MRVGLDRSRFPGSHVTPGAPARKEVFETALEGPARTQSDVFLVFSRTGNPLVRTVFLRGQQKLTKNSSTDFTLLATIVTIVAEQLNLDAQEAQYTTKTTTPVATEGDEEKKQNSEFSLVYFLALFLSRFKCAFCQRSLRQRRDALKSLPRVSHFELLRASQLPGNLNEKADEESRIMKDRPDWMLCPEIFRSIQAQLGSLEIDLFGRG